jgi:UDP-2,3-diacylglucosamine pyrophosphatase LpxH
MRFQLLSDIHLEFRKDFPNIVPAAENLILAGDIGWPTMDNFNEFMKDVTRKFSNVFYVTGNHEYYCKIPKLVVDGKIESLSKQLGFHFLNNRFVTMEGIKVMGCTLWTECNQHNFKTLEFHMNDYRNIYTEDLRLATPFSTGRWHYESVKFIEKELSNNDRPTLMISHHLPSYSAVHPQYVGHPANCGFVTDLDRLFTPESGLAAWVCGHTHSHYSGTVNSIPLYINPVGYMGQNPDVNYNFTFEINQTSNM